MSKSLTITANIKPRSPLPTIEQQYVDLWRFAGALESIGCPRDAWFPPAATEAESLLNKAFDDHGPTLAAIALAKADRDNMATDIRSAGVWNGIEGTGGMAFTTLLSSALFPSNLEFTSKGVQQLADYRKVVQLIKAIIEIWNPLLIQVDPDHYSDQAVFPNRPAVGWMIYLPVAVRAAQVPEAYNVVAIPNDSGNGQKGTLVIAVDDEFDVSNSQHIRIANSIETRLVDQDLLPTYSELRAGL
ncbi:MAG: Imm52 family immunity protein [Gammaproteobacteria bacterium]